MKIRVFRGKKSQILKSFPRDKVKVNMCFSFYMEWESILVMKAIRILHKSHHFLVQFFPYENLHFLLLNEFYSSQFYCL